MNTFKLIPLILLAVISKYSSGQSSKDKIDQKLECAINILDSPVMLLGIPDDNTNQNSYSGTAFYIADITQTIAPIYLITAKHVLGKFDADGVFVLKHRRWRIFFNEDLTKENTESVDIDLVPAINQGWLQLHPKADIAAICAGFLVNSGNNDLGFTHGPYYLKGFEKNYENNSNSPSRAIGCYQILKSIKDTEFGQEVFISGYPTSLYNKDSPVFSPFRPLIRKGIISSVNYTVKTLILDCPVYKGNSGGPVYQIDEEGVRSIVGLITQFIPDNKTMDSITQNSGYALALGSDYIKQIIEQSDKAIDLNEIELQE